MNRALISSILLLLSTLHFHAQKIPDYSLKHNMKQDGLSMEFTVLDPDKKQPSRHHTNKIYFWYKAQQVLKTQGGHAGIPLHGTFRSFYFNKQLCDQGEFRKGLKVGKWTYWNPDGTLNRQEHWKSGEQRGKQYYYGKDGKLQKIVTIYRYCGKRHPDSLEWVRGRHTKITLYDPSGNKMAVERYYNGLKDGKSTYYSDSSQHSVMYRDGIAENPSEKAAESAKSGTLKQKKGFLEKVKFWKRKDAAAESTSNPGKEKKNADNVGEQEVKKRAKKKKNGTGNNGSESRPKKEKHKQSE